MNAVKSARRRARMTALELGQRAGINEMRVYQLERGRFPPHPDEAAALSRVLGVKVETLFPERKKANQ